MKRVYNFSAGPGVLPREVLEQAKREMLGWGRSGMSVMEMSHRGDGFMEIATQAEDNLRKLLRIPTSYKILFLQGGATSQFSMVPMNLLRGRKSADYILTGEWSKKALTEAKRYCTVNTVATSEDEGFNHIPTRKEWELDSNAAYVHYTSNETINGVQFHLVPKTEKVPLVADMSSDILSRLVDISKYGLIYASAQKNIGSAGLTVVIIREDLIGKTLPRTPTMFDYKIHADKHSMYNTPPTYSIYIAGLVFKWLKLKGGLKRFEKSNIRKAEHLYNYIDQTDFYHSSIVKSDRSLMNIPFTMKNTLLEEVFLKRAKARGLVQLKGHRSVGGMRASIYNAMPEEGVRALVKFMKEFEKKYG